MDVTQSYARDIARVILNREDTVIPIDNFVEKRPSLVEMSNYLADLYYTAINDALDHLEGVKRLDLGRELLWELSHHVGVDVFDDIASDLVDE